MTENKQSTARAKKPPSPAKPKAKAKVTSAAAKKRKSKSAASPMPVEFKNDISRVASNKADKPRTSSVRTRRTSTRPVPVQNRKQQRNNAARPTYAQRFTSWTGSEHFGSWFATASVIILFLSTLFWTALAVRLHSYNADQLIDAYMFENIQTFNDAIFPGTHSFLIKWPLFATMSLLGNSQEVFMAFTILMVLATLGTLIYILHKIERRPIAFGILCLALSSVLLSIPAQPYAGALLPVNMGMSTTRNLEYAVFILVMYYGISVRRINSRAYIAAIAFMVLLIASDKLFLALAIGGGLFAAVWYALWFKHREALRWSVQWLVIVIPAAALATVLLLVLNGLNVTTIGEGEMASPYPLIDSARQFVIGSIFAVSALLTNYGANPIYDVLVVQDIPGALLSGLTNISIVGYVINMFVLMAALYAVFRILFHSRAAHDAADTTYYHRWIFMCLLLIGSSITAAGVFILTDHYYPVDARYLAIALFAGFIAAATHYRSWKPRAQTTTIIVSLLLLALPIGIYNSWSSYRASDNAMAEQKMVTNRVADEVERSGISRLIGDYWDIVPVKSKTAEKLTVSPVDRCIMPRPVLTSTAWFRQPANTPTAYLAVKDTNVLQPEAPKRNATYNGCSLARVVGTYGVPSQRVSIVQSATPENGQDPDILLLLYPDGIKPPPLIPADSKGDNQQSKTSIAKKQLLVPLAAVTEKDVCSRGTTLQVVAHQDDDILFMNPDVLASVRDGRCIRTVYLTAGDAGENISYWGEREKGAKAAYADMYGVENIWREEQQLLAGETVNVSYLQDVPQIVLLFMRLPDGNQGGQGFSGHNNESLRRMLSGEIAEISAVDGSARYTKQKLIESLREILARDMPDQIRTQGSNNDTDGDHADHHDAGKLVAEAATSYARPYEMIRYIGYPSRLLPVNLTDDDITIKQKTFLVYAKFDGAVCQTAFECQKTHTYGSYLARQYQPEQIIAP